MKADGTLEGKSGVGEKKATAKRYTVSQVFTDGTVADMVYSKIANQAQFAIGDGVKTELINELVVGKDGNLVASKNNAAPGRGFVPSAEAKMLVEKNLIYLPSGIEEYGAVQALFEEVRTFIKTFVLLEDSRFYDVSAVYVLMSWVFDRFGAVPYLRVVGDLGTGKSRFLEVVGKLCNRSIMASGSMSMAAVYRTIDSIQGTLVFDEADFKSSDMTSEIVKLLNSGHKEDASVVRMEIVNNRMRTTAFRVFGPKIFGSRHGFEDNALNSRCIIQRLFPLKDLEGVSVHLPPSFEADAQHLRNKLLMFRLKNHHLMNDDESTVEKIGFPRLKQTALALTSVAKVVGEETLESVVSFLVDAEQDLLNSVSTDELADTLFCIAWIIETDEKVRESGRLYMGRIAEEFNNWFYDDYTTRMNREIKTDTGPLMIPGQVVSARKIGAQVDKLGLNKERGSHGMFIPLHKEVRRINALVDRYKLAHIIAERKENKLQREKADSFEADIPNPF
jgi:hypothetical protein